jgi:hypothetical protein
MTDSNNHSSAATTGPLLPCPFCGSKPVRFWTSDYQQLAQVRCENDDCFGPSTPVASARDADRMWNRRISVPAQQPIDPDLVQRCKELLGWSKTGLLNGGSGGAVRALADRLRPKIGDHYALNVAENQTRDDAMREIVRLAAQPPAAPVEKAGVMQAAANAAEKVAGWSPSKREYAERVMGGTPFSAGTAELSDWSRLPRDLYVTSVKSIDGIVFDVQCCSVPMAIGPEVRYTQVAAQPQEASKP